MLAVLFMVLSASPPAEGLGADFERELIQRALQAQGRELEPEPAGKTIDEVLVVSEEIMGQRDPWPDVLNIFHTRTKEEVVRREVLLAPGETWNRDRVQETERNLRRMIIFAVTRVVAVRGGPGHVSLLVVTKDRWSLRVNSEFNLVGSTLQYLRLRPAEMNFLGLNIQASLDLLLKLDTLDVGEYLLLPRVLGQKVRLAEQADLVFNRDTKALEGTAGFFLVDRPFYSLDQRWSWSAFVQWNVRRQRVFRGEAVEQLNYPDALNPGITVPFVYDFRDVQSEATVTRRFGERVLIDVSAGLFGYDTAATPPVGTLSDDQSRWLAANFLPRTESAAGLLARARVFEPRFVVLKNIDTLEISEDYQLGPLLQASTRWGLPVKFTTASYLEAAASLRYRWYLGGDLLTVQASISARFTTAGLPLNRHYVAQLENYSPLFYGGRLVSKVTLDVRQNDLNNPRVFLGGENGLRGAAPQELSGRNYVLGSFEYRARSFELATVYTSITVFYDVGSAFDDVPVLTHTVGLGLRILLPQFNQEVVKINFGLVVGGAAPSASRLVTSEPTPAGLAPDFLNNPP